MALALALPHSALGSDPAGGEIVHLPIPPENVSTAAPEPNTALLAGLGGLALLFFALRRK
ncbi:MAG: PEP-CTERM sorting domain-containing protein [Akkermansiaceae bacterium]|nr:PEP-CTERM sorting domain-containing protein [Akkermansiaceae bacterium]